MGPLERARLFTARSLADVQRFLASLSPPLLVALDDTGPDRITQYPKPEAELTRRVLRQRQRAEERLQRKAALWSETQARQLEDTDELVAG